MPTGCGKHSGVSSTCYTMQRLVPPIVLFNPQTFHRLRCIVHHYMTFSSSVSVCTKSAARSFGMLLFLYKDEQAESGIV
jgi:hypothetical protein